MYLTEAKTGGSFHNLHTPEACAQLCLDDAKCKAFDAARRFPVQDDNQGLRWNDLKGNCFLSYLAYGDVGADSVVRPKCNINDNNVVMSSFEDEAELDPDCFRKDSNKIDYYERISGEDMLFLKFKNQYGSYLKWDALVNPTTPIWPMKAGKDGTKYRVPLAPGNQDSLELGTFQKRYFPVQKFSYESYAPRGLAHPTFFYYRNNR